MLALTSDGLTLVGHARDIAEALSGACSSIRIGMSKRSKTFLAHGQMKSYLVLHVARDPAPAGGHSEYAPETLGQHHASSGEVLRSALAIASAWRNQVGVSIFSCAFPCDVSR